MLPVSVSVPLLAVRVVQVPVRLSASTRSLAERVSMTPVTVPSPATTRLAARVCAFCVPKPEYSSA